MQRERVKAHELRTKDEAALVAELTKFRVHISFILFELMHYLERVSITKSKQGISSSTS